MRVVVFLMALLCSVSLGSQVFGGEWIDTATPETRDSVYHAGQQPLLSYPPLRARYRAIEVEAVHVAGSDSPSVTTIADRWHYLPKQMLGGVVPHPDSVYWCRLLLRGGPYFSGTQLLNVGPRPLDELYSFARIDAYVRSAVSGWQRQRLGREVSVRDRPVSTWINLLSVPGVPGDTTEVLVRLAGANPVFQPTAIRFWHVDPLPLLPEQSRRAFLDGIFYGLVGLQIVFFFLLFLIERERIYGWFAVYCLGIFLFTAFSIVLDEYYAPFPWWDRTHLLLASIGFSVAHTGFLCFTMTYFEISFRQRPWRYVISLVLAVSWTANLITGLFKTSASWFTPGFRALEILDNALGILVCLLAVWIVVSSPPRRGASKKFYLLALSPIIFMAAYYLGQDIIVGLQGQELVYAENVASLGWFKVAALTMLMLLSLGIGQRNNRLREEKLTVQQHLIENLRQTDQLQEIDRLKTRFYTNITHEFRTPLTIILGLAGRLTEAQGGALILRNGRRLLSLVNRLLDLSRLNSGTLRANYRRVDVVTYLRYLGESYRSLAESRGVTLTIYCEERQLSMDLDRERFRQLFSNLLTNAIKFTPSGGRVIAHLSRQGDELRVRVSDTGTGIAARDLDRIFDRFYQTDTSSSRKGEGTGIGLALVREIVTLLEGRVTVESVVGEGTTFTVWLPIRHTVTEAAADSPESTDEAVAAEDAIATLPLLPEVPPEDREQENSQLPHLLLIEDSPDIVAYLRAVLQPYYRVSVATDGSQGIVRALEEIPDIILSDVMMPEQDGFAVTERLKGDVRTSHIPIVLLTARATQQDRLTGLRYGADAYLKKPFHEQELLVQLDALIRSRQQLQQHYREYAAPSAPATSPDERFLQRLQQVLDAHFTDSTFGVNDYAAALSISHTQLYRKLKALTDLTPSRYVSDYRLAKGKALLHHPDQHVSEVAYAVGFRDPNYFTRLFGERYGMSPNAYRSSVVD